MLGTSTPLKLQLVVSDCALYARDAPDDAIIPYPEMFRLVQKLMARFPDMAIEKVKNEVALIKALSCDIALIFAPPNVVVPTMLP